MLGHRMCVHSKTLVQEKFPQNSTRIFLISGKMVHKEGAGAASIGRSEAVLGNETARGDNRKVGLEPTVADVTRNT